MDDKKKNEYDDFWEKYTKPDKFQRKLRKMKNQTILPADAKHGACQLTPIELATAENMRY